MDPTPAAAPAVAPEPTPGTSSTPSSVYTRLGPPADNSPDFRFSRPVEFVPVIQALAKVLNFKPPAPTSIQEDSEFSVFGTSSGSTVIAPIPWASDQVVKAATGTDDRRVVKEASSFGDSTLSSSRYQRMMRLSSKFLRLITRLWSICGAPRIQTGIRPSRLAPRSLKPPVRRRNSPSCRKHWHLSWAGCGSICNARRGSFLGPFWPERKNAKPG